MSKVKYIDIGACGDQLPEDRHECPASEVYAMSEKHRITNCPACGGSDFAIGRLVCEDCGTAIDGRFALSRLAALDESQLSFVITFLESRGNISDVERKLGISYPTVRSRLDRVVRKLGVVEDDVQAKRRAVLTALQNREMSPDEAVATLRDLQ